MKIHARPLTRRFDVWQFKHDWEGEDVNEFPANKARRPDGEAHLSGPIAASFPVVRVQREFCVHVLAFEQERRLKCVGRHFCAEEMRKERYCRLLCCITLWVPGPIAGQS